MKASPAWHWMKKDMGGAAARWVRRRCCASSMCDRSAVVIPVENSVDGNSFRPGDVAFRKGLTVEITNTMRRGGLVLGRWLAMASESSPSCWWISRRSPAAARVALGPELPPVYGGSQELVRELLTVRMP